MQQEHRQPRETYTPRHAFQVFQGDLRDWCGRVVDEYDGWPVYCGFLRSEHYVLSDVPSIPPWQAWRDA